VFATAFNQYAVRGIRGECGRLSVEAVRSQAGNADDRERRRRGWPLRSVASEAKLDALSAIGRGQAAAQKANSGKVMCGRRATAARDSARFVLRRSKRHDQRRDPDRGGSLKLQDAEELMDS